MDGLKGHLSELKRKTDVDLRTGSGLELIIEKALAFDESARMFLRARYQNSENTTSEDAKKIQEYFLQTAKEGDPDSCAVIQAARLVSMSSIKKHCLEIRQ